MRKEVEQKVLFDVQRCHCCWQQICTGLVAGSQKEKESESSWTRTLQHCSGGMGEQTDKHAIRRVFSTYENNWVWFRGWEWDQAGLMASTGANSLSTGAAEPDV